MCSARSLGFDAASLRSSNDSTSSSCLPSVRRTLSSALAVARLSGSSLSKPLYSFSADSCCDAFSNKRAARASRRGTARRVPCSSLARRSLASAKKPSAMCPGSAPKSIIDSSLAAASSSFGFCASASNISGKRSSAMKLGGRCEVCHSLRSPSSSSAPLRGRCSGAFSISVRTSVSTAGDAPLPGATNESGSADSTQMTERDVGCALAAERRFARDQLVKQHSEGINVAGRVGRFAAQHLGRQVGDQRCSPGSNSGGRAKPAPASTSRTLGAACVVSVTITLPDARHRARGLRRAG